MKNNLEAAANDPVSLAQGLSNAHETAVRFARSMRRILVGMHAIDDQILGNPNAGAILRTFFEDFVNGLLIAGFAMQAHGNSRPASGSEHQISHVWEMESLTVNGEPAAHGACVGVGAVAMLALYEWFLAQDVAAAASEHESPADFDRRAIDAEVQASFPEWSLVESARTEMSAKLARAGARPLRLRALGTAWHGLREQIEATLVPSATMEQWLSACGAASHPADLGVPLTKLAADYRRARLIRRRYTILDCLEDLGWLDKAIEALFASGGFWGRRPRRSKVAAAVNAS